MAKIETFGDKFPGRTLAEHAAAHPGRAGQVMPPREDVTDEAPFEARVDHGRWIVDCPDCSGAEFALDSLPVFFCCSCRNVAVDGRRRPVALPSGRTEIEAALLVRPIENRNWRPGETIEHLLAENAEHGLEEDV